MDKTLEYIEGTMDEGLLYFSVAVNAFKSAFLLLLILGAGWVVYSFIVPAAMGGHAGVYLAYLVVTIVAFMYVFKPVGYLEKIGWGAYSVLFSAGMYLSGECVVIALIVCGVMLGTAVVFGEVIFTGLFTYRDLKEWVKNDKYRKQSAESLAKAKEAEQWKNVGANASVENTELNDKS
jgi:hypothetical protein